MKRNNNPKKEKRENQNQNDIDQNVSQENLYINFKNLERQLLEKNTQIDILRNELEYSKNETQKYKNSYKTLLREKENISKNFHDLDQTHKDFINQFNDLRSRNEQINKLASEIRINNENLKKENKKFIEVNKSLENNIKLINLDLQEKIKQQYEYYSEIKQLKEALRISEKKEKNISEKYSKKSEEFGLNKKKLNETELNLSNVANELKSIKEQKDKNEIKFQKEISQLKEELEKNKNAFDLKAKELKNFHSKFDGTLSHFGNIDKQMEIKDKEIVELKKYKEENKILNEKIHSLNKVINIGETKEEYLTTPAEKFYDVIIDIKSINSLKTEGWKILYNEEMERNI